MQAGFCVGTQQATVLLRAQDHKCLIKNQNRHQLFNRYRVRQLEEKTWAGRDVSCMERCAETCDVELVELMTMQSVLWIKSDPESMLRSPRAAFRKAATAQIKHRCVTYIFLTEPDSSGTVLSPPPPPPPLSGGQKIPKFQGKRAKRNCKSVLHTHAHTQSAAVSSVFTHHYLSLSLHSLILKVKSVSR